MGLLSRLGGGMMGAMRGAGGMADNAMAAGDNMAMQAAPRLAQQPQAQAFIQQLRARTQELQQQPFLPPRLRQELNENMDILRRLEAGEL